MVPPKEQAAKLLARFITVIDMSDLTVAEGSLQAETRKTAKILLGWHLYDILNHVLVNWEGPIKKYWEDVRDEAEKLE